MDVYSCIKTRRSIRKYKNKRIPENTLKEILQVATYAPSSCNQQMYYFINVEDEKIRARLEKEAGFWLNKRLPHAIFVIADKRFGSELFANIQSAAAGIENILLYAHSLGLGGLWMCGVGDRGVIKKILNVSNKYHLVGCIGLGYSDETPPIPTKRQIEEIYFKNSFLEPNSKKSNPDYWDYIQINSLAERAIFAHSPEVGYKHLFKIQFENELSYISKHLGKENLSVYEISGTYLFELAAKNTDKNFYSITSSEKIAEWLDLRAKSLNLKNIKCVKATLEDIKTKKFNAVLLLELMNRVPTKQRQAIINSCKNLIDGDGKIILSVLNRNSLYGYLFRKGVSRRFGPEISLSHGDIKKLLNKTELKTKERVGFNLFPSPKLFFKIGVPGKYTFLNAMMRRLASKKLLEDSINYGILKNFSSSNIYILERAKNNKIDQSRGI